MTAIVSIAACAPRAPSGMKSDSTSAASGPHPREVEAAGAPKLQFTTPHRASLGHGAELYIPPWFVSDKGAYDLVVHFHGLAKIQEANLEQTKLNVVMVSVNLGGTSDPYSRNYKDGREWAALLERTQAAVEASGRANGQKIRRIALTAWSAGFLAISRVLHDPETLRRVDAILLADGFFSSYTNPRTREINLAPLEQWVKVTEAAKRDEKLLAITHSAIPGFTYPGVEEVVGELLRMTSLEKTPSTNVGPRNMHETYVVDHGGLHVRGYEGQRAGDHIKHIRAMGETLYPYLARRWSTYAPPR